MAHGKSLIARYLPSVVPTVLHDYEQPEEKKARKREQEQRRREARAKRQRHG